MGLKSVLQWLRTPLISLPDATFDGEDRWDGPDDLWPEEPPLPYRPSLQVVEDAEGPELITVEQYGLRCPGGETHWGSWQGIPFDQPLDRLKMVATLQQTALDMGFAADQIDDFLAYYGWVTRNSIATVVYENTGAYPLTDPAALGTLENKGSVHDHQSETRDDADDSPREVRPGSMGSDAQ